MIDSAETEPPNTDFGELQWIKCFTVCRFDENQGPIVDYTVPRNATVPTRLIALRAFPDSNSAGPKIEQQPSDSSFAMRLQTGEEKDQSYLGASYFRLAHDTQGQTRRGGVQRAVCVVSEIVCQPSYALFLKDLINVIGPMFFMFEDDEEQILESACSSIAKWPFVHSLTPLELPLMGHVLNSICPLVFQGTEEQARVSYYGFNVIPQWSCTNEDVLKTQAAEDEEKEKDVIEANTVKGRQRTTPNDLKEIITSQLSDHLKVQSGPIYLALREFSEQLWLIWEQVIVGDPIIVFGGRGADFEQFDEVLLLLMSLITPVNYSNDYRPTLTVYDPDYRTICNGLAGTGNPFVCQTLMDAQKKEEQNSLILCLGSTNTLNFQKNEMECKISCDKASLYYRGPVPILPTSQNLLRALLTPQNLTDRESAQVLLNDSLIRRHFYDLTVNFIKPFLPYFTSNVPNSGSNAKAKQFIAKEFVDELKPLGDFANLPLAKVKGLYTRFLKGPNFVPWFNIERRAVVKRKKQLVISQRSTIRSQPSQSPTSSERLSRPANAPGGNLECPQSSSPERYVNQKLHDSLIDMSAPIVDGGNQEQQHIHADQGHRSNQKLPSIKVNDPLNLLKKNVVHTEQQLPQYTLENQLDDALRLPRAVSEDFFSPTRSLLSLDMDLPTPSPKSSTVAHPLTTDIIGLPTTSSSPIHNIPKLNPPNSINTDIIMIPSSPSVPINLLDDNEKDHPFEDIEILPNLMTSDHFPLDDITKDNNDNPFE